MKTKAALRASALLALATVLLCSTATAGNWIGSWTASPQSSWTPEFVLPMNAPVVISNQTIRQIVRVSLGGRRVRIAFSNAYGKAPVVVGAAHIARAGGGSRIVPGSDRIVTFGAQPSAEIQPGEGLLSDPVDLEVDPLDLLAVSLYLPHASPIDTFHWDARQTAFLADGNQSAAPEMRGNQALTTRVYLSELQVEAAADARVVVALGDSITDGNGATIDSNQRWPDALANGFAERGVAVLNAGISGGRLLKSGMGDSGLVRFERDVLSQPKLETVVLLLGINDISWPGSTFAPKDAPIRAEQLIAGYRQLIARAHARSVRLVVGTITPFEGALEGSPIKRYYSADKDRVRGEVNEWIRHCGEFDAVVDFDAVLRDPLDPARLLPRFDSGDHLHPGDEGNRAMAAALDDVVLFGPSRRPHH